MCSSQKGRDQRRLLAATAVFVIASLDGSAAIEAAETRNAGLVLQCLGYAGQAGPATAEGAAFDALAALAATLPVKAEFAFLAPAFLSQSEDFWRGYMIAMSTDNAVRFSKDEARQLFIEARCAELTK